MNRRFEFVAGAARALLKELVWATSSHTRGDKPDVCLFATRRGGSTWLMEIVGANRRFRTIDQPLSLQSRTVSGPQVRRTPKFDLGVVAHVDEDQEVKLTQFFEAVFEGALPVNAPFRFWRRGFNWRTDRVVIKLTGANPIIDWMEDRFSPRIVYLSRHPLPQAMSCIRNGWTLETGAYLRSTGFLDRHLTDRQVAVARQISKQGTVLEKFVLNWTLENLVPIKLLPEHPSWTHVSYEECVVDPERTITRLADRLELPDRDRMLAQVESPSVSTRFLSSPATREAIAGRDAAHLLGHWRSEVSHDDERAAFRILDTFEIDMYRYGEDLPVTTSS